MKKLLAIVLLAIAGMVATGCNAQVITFEDGSARIVVNDVTIVIHSDN